MKIQAISGLSYQSDLPKVLSPGHRQVSSASLLDEANGGHSFVADTSHVAFLLKEYDGVFELQLLDLFDVLDLVVLGLLIEIVEQVLVLDALRGHTIAELVLEKL